MSSGDKAGDPVQDRKRQHMELALSGIADSATTPGWDDVRLVPAAVPDVSIDDVALDTEFLGHRLGAPLLIAGMTGGHPAAVEINSRLGRLAAERNVAIGVGSQRAAMLDPALVESYSVVRKMAPDAVVVANIGSSQLVEQSGEPGFGPGELRRLAGMVEAQILAIHLNVLEELIQPEGDRNSSGHFAAIAAAVSALDIPVMIKETGSGIDRATARRLVDSGVAAIDVGGLGGTNFARIEGERAAALGDTRGERLADTFSNWGIPTAAAILEARDLGVPVVATGGVRTGLDAAKALALRGDLVGVGRPFLRAAGQGQEQLDEAVTLHLEELRVAMVLTGNATISTLHRTPVVMTGLVAAWSDALDNRGR